MPKTETNCASSCSDSNHGEIPVAHSFNAATNHMDAEAKISLVLESKIASPTDTNCDGLATASFNITASGDNSSVVETGRENEATNPLVGKNKKTTCMHKDWKEYRYLSTATAP